MAAMAWYQVGDRLQKGFPPFAVLDLLWWVCFSRECGFMEQLHLPPRRQKLVDHYTATPANCWACKQTAEYTYADMRAASLYSSTETVVYENVCMYVCMHAGMYV